MTKQVPISEVIAAEKNLRPKPEFLHHNVYLSEAYYPLIDRYPVRLPVIVLHKPHHYLPLYTNYFYTPKDSVVRFVLYDWDKAMFVSSPEEERILKKEHTKFKKYNREYERIKALAIDQLGIPIEEDREAKPTKEYEETYLSRTTRWENDAIKAELNMIFALNTHRIRLVLYWKDR
ncbi:hypothetical protein M1D52_09375 [Olivibacter sp. SA151]|uniref:hypothetical protein n=1 Tax=Olivibacter jilunii TaxID=985016 RepID=UPI003F13AD7B